MAGAADKGKVEPIGEVLSASITSISLECWQATELSLPLKFGSFLRAEAEGQGLSVVGVVYDIITGPADSNHKPVALHLRREQLKLEQPHIFALLRTEIQAAIIGYMAGGRILTDLPPQPPQVHDFVFPLSSAEVRAFTDCLDFLPLLANVKTVPADELLAAAIREACRARDNDTAFLIKAGQALSRLYRDDYDRLLALLNKIRPGRASLEYEGA